MQKICECGFSDFTVTYDRVTQQTHTLSFSLTLSLILPPLSLPFLTCLRSLFLTRFMHAFHLRIRVLVSSSVTVLLSSCFTSFTGVSPLVTFLFERRNCDVIYVSNVFCNVSLSLVVRPDSFRHLQGIVDFSPFVLRRVPRPPLFAPSRWGFTGVGPRIHKSEDKRR